mmetsp:Transcript_17143/g.41107  ORF Transcript_17143/g.41107 Transcript_17143/m.41107 type:complete len:202 (-) Transcript_17143:35-640(-)
MQAQSRLLDHGATSLGDRRRLLYRDLLRHLPVVHSPRLLSISAPAHTIAHARVVRVAVYFDAAVRELVLAPAVSLTVAEHALEAVPIVVVISPKSMNGILLPVAHVHVSVREVAFALSPPFPVDIISRVDVPVVESTRALAVKSILLPLTGIFGAIVKVNRPSSVNVPVFKFSNILIPVGPFQLTVAVPLPRRIVLPRVGA